MNKFRHGFKKSIFSILSISIFMSATAFAGSNNPNSENIQVSSDTASSSNITVTGKQTIAEQGDCSKVTVTVSGTLTGTNDDGGGNDIVIFELWDDGTLKDSANVSVAVGTTKSFSINMEFKGTYLTGAAGVGVYANELGWSVDPFYPTDVIGSCNEHLLLSIIPVVTNKQVQAIVSIDKLFQYVKSQARIGDILLFNACDAATTEPIQCSANVIEGLTMGVIQGVGYGFFQHAALIYKIEDNGIRVLQARGPNYGVGADTNNDLITPATLVAHHIRRVQFVRVNNITNSTAQEVVNSTYSLYNNSQYDNWFLPYNGKVYCSELIWDAYNRFANIDLSDKTLYPYYGLIVPDDLMTSSHITPLGGFAVPAW